MTKVHAKLAGAVDAAPAGALPPLVKPHSIDDVPVLALTLHGASYDANALRELAIHLEDEIRTVPEVAETFVVGGAPKQFQVALEKLIAMSRQKRLAIMCAEAVPWRCHRSLVADALNARAVPVIEILSESNFRAHKLTAFAQVDGTRITYPSAQAKLL